MRTPSLAFASAMALAVCSAVAAPATRPATQASFTFAELTSDRSYRPAVRPSDLPLTPVSPERAREVGDLLVLGLKSELGEDVKMTWPSMDKGLSPEATIAGSKGNGQIALLPSGGMRVTLFLKGQLPLLGEEAATYARSLVKRLWGADPGAPTSLAFNRGLDFSASWAGEDGGSSGPNDLITLICASPLPATTRPTTVPLGPMNVVLSLPCGAKDWPQHSGTARARKDGGIGREEAQAWAVAHLDAIASHPRDKYRLGDLLARPRTVAETGVLRAEYRDGRWVLWFSRPPESCVATRGIIMMSLSVSGESMLSLTIAALDPRSYTGPATRPAADIRTSDEYLAACHGLARKRDDMMGRWKAARPQVGAILAEYYPGKSEAMAASAEVTRHATIGSDEIRVVLLPDTDRPPWVTLAVEGEPVVKSISLRTQKTLELPTTMPAAASQELLESRWKQAFGEVPEGDFSLDSPIRRDRITGETTISGRWVPSWNGVPLGQGPWVNGAKGRYSRSRGTWTSNAVIIAHRGGTIVQFTRPVSAATVRQAVAELDRWGGGNDPRSACVTAIGHSSPNVAMPRLNPADRLDAALILLEPAEVYRWTSMTHAVNLAARGMKLVPLWQVTHEPGPGFAYTMLVDPATGDVLTPR